MYSKEFAQLIIYLCMNYWGEPERAPHRQVCCGNNIYIVCRAVSHFRLLFCKFLRHLLTQKLITNILSEKARTGVPPRWQQQVRRPLEDLLSCVKDRVLIKYAKLDIYW